MLSTPFSLQSPVPSAYSCLGPVPARGNQLCVSNPADVFLDGQKVGEQKAPAAALWDRLCNVALPDDFDPTVAHTLVVRVCKDSFSAGIWRPVSIVSAGS